MLTLISFIVLLLILIFVHELGHFMAAKLLGVKVERFSLGFPPKAFAKTIGETEYQLAWLPLGGYVKMLGEDPHSEEGVPPELRHRSFSHQPPWAKMIIVLAGPAFNLVFAAFLYVLITWGGGLQHMAPILGPVDPVGPAGRAGLMMDDTLMAIDGRPVQFYDDLVLALGNGQGAALNLTVKRGGLEESFQVTPKAVATKTIFNDPVEIYSLGLSPRLKPVIARVMDDMPAQASGLLAGDRILTINGEPTPDWQDVLTAIQGPPGQRLQEKLKTMAPITLEIERAGQIFFKTMTPVMTPSQDSDGRTVYTPLIGMEPKAEFLIEPIGFFNAIGLGLSKTGSMIEMMLISVQKLITRDVSAKTLGGPIMIAEITGEQARAGLLPLLGLAAFISINLGILNLLPIPVLDGGQLVFFIIEVIRRKPISLRVREVFQWAGVGLLGFLMIMVFYNDIGRLITRWQAKTPVESSAPSVEAGS